MIEPEWATLAVALAIHDEQLWEHGGLAGVRSLELLESALARPRHVIAFGAPDLFDLAACYAYGIARNHPFNDGNKRTAFVICAVFLDLNGFEISAGDEDCVMRILALASGELPEADFAAWLRASTASLGQFRNKTET